MTACTSFPIRLVADPPHIAAMRHHGAVDFQQRQGLSIGQARFLCEGVYLGRDLHAGGLEFLLGGDAPHQVVEGGPESVRNPQQSFAANIRAALDLRQEALRYPGLLGHLFKGPTSLCSDESDSPTDRVVSHVVCHNLNR